MNVLVTGGAGYIGSHTVHALRARGHRAISLDNLIMGHRSSVPKGSLVEGDIADKTLLSKLLTQERIEAVVACAALADVPDSVANPCPYF